MCTYETLSVHVFECDLEECFAKMRYGRFYNPEEDCDIKLTRAEQELFADEEASSRNIYDEGVQVYDVRKRNIRDIKNNPRVTLPKPLSGHEEAMIACVQADFMRIFNEYMAKNCGEAGNIKTPNLTIAQLRGLRSLLKRIRAREIMVVPTDKSGKLMVVNWSVYVRNMEKIIGSDREVGWAEVGPTQDRMNGHVSLWIKMTKYGDDWNQTQRIREAMIRHGECVPPPVWSPQRSQA